MSSIKQFLSVAAMAVCVSAQSQTNTFPASGNTGIGTTSPSSQLHLWGTGATTLTVEGANQNSAYGRIELRGRPSASGHSVGYMVVLSTRGGQSATGVAALDFVKEGSGADDKTGIAFASNDGSSTAERVRFSGTGNVGIGTPAPTSKLHLYGTSGATALTIEGAENDVTYGRINLSGRPTSNGHSVGYIQVNSTRAGQTAVPVAAIDFPKQGSDSDDKTYMAFSTHNGSSIGERLRITADGKLGIGISAPTERLSVEGNIYANGNLSANGNVKAKKIIVTQLGWSDYVFHKEYKLRSLASLESFINRNKHLPEIPSAKEVEENGVSIGETQALLLKKIEELTLYVIAIQKENDQLKRAQKKGLAYMKQLEKKIKRQ